MPIVHLDVNCASLRVPTRRVVGQFEYSAEIYTWLTRAMMGMPSRSSKPKREGTPHDFTTIARRVVEQAIGEKLDRSPLEDKDKGKNPPQSR